MNRNKKSLIVIVAAVAVGYFFLGREDLIVSGVEWACDGDECDVTFYVANRSENKLQRNISIRAFSKRAAGKGAAQNRVVGEKRIWVGVAPFQRKQIRATLLLAGTGKVQFVAVNPLDNN